MRKFFGGTFDPFEDDRKKKALKRLATYRCEQCGHAPAKKIVNGTMLCGKDHKPKRRKYA